MPEQSYLDRYRHLQGLIVDLTANLPGPMSGFARMRKEALRAGVLSASTKELMALAIAIAVHCDGCIAFHVHDALAAGATHAEVLEAIGVAVAMGGGPAVIYAAEAHEALAQFAAQNVR